MNSSYKITADNQVLVCMQATAKKNFMLLIQVAYNDDVMNDPMVRKQFIRACLANIFVFPFPDVVDAFFKGSANIHGSLGNFNQQIWKMVDETLMDLSLYKKIRIVLNWLVSQHYTSSTRVKWDEEHMSQLKLDITNRRELSLAALIFSGYNVRKGKTHIWHEINAVLIDPTVCHPPDKYPTPKPFVHQRCQPRGQFLALQLARFYEDTFGSVTPPDVVIAFHTGAAPATPRNAQKNPGTHATPSTVQKRQAATPDALPAPKRRRMADMQPRTLLETFSPPRRDVMPGVQAVSPTLPALSPALPGHSPVLPVLSPTLPGPSPMVVPRPFAQAISPPRRRELLMPHPVPAGLLYSLHLPPKPSLVRPDSPGVLDPHPLAVSGILDPHPLAVSGPHPLAVSHPGSRSDSPLLSQGSAWGPEPTPDAAPRHLTREDLPLMTIALLERGLLSRCASPAPWSVPCSRSQTREPTPGMWPNEGNSREPSLGL